jgi:hypothetical protein
MLTKVIHTCTSCLLLDLYTPQCNDAADLLALGLFDSYGNVTTVGSEHILQQQRDLMDSFNNSTATNSDAAAAAAAMASYTVPDIYGGISSNSMYGTLARSSSSSPEAVAAAEAAAANYGLGMPYAVSVY